MENFQAFNTTHKGEKRDACQETSIFSGHLLRP